MFWRFGIQSGSNIDSLLDAEPDKVSHEAILDQSDILQEVKSKNPKLIEYLCRPDTVNKLLAYIIKLHLVPVISPDAAATAAAAAGASQPQQSQSPPSSTTPSANNENNDQQQQDPNAAAAAALADQVTRQENLRVRYPYVISEIFSTDIPELLDAVFVSPATFPDLLTLLDLPTPLDPLQAAYWSKIMSNLLIRKTQPTLAALKASANLVPKLVVHAMDNANLMDLLLKLVGVEELPAGKAEGSSAWLHAAGLHVPDTHGTASAALLDMVAMVQAICVEGERMEDNPLVRELKSERVVNLLVKRMLDVGAPRAASTLVHSVALFVELIRRNSADMSQVFQQQANPDAPDANLPAASRVPMNLCAMIRALCLHLPDMQALLLNNSFGTRELPLGDPPAPGMPRRLLAELLRCAIEEAIMDADDEEAEIERIRGLPASPTSAVVGGDTSPLDSYQDLKDGIELEKQLAVHASESSSSSAGTTVTFNETVRSGAAAGAAMRTPAAMAARHAQLARVYGPDLQALLRQTIADSRILVSTLDLFFFFPWNNLLHGIVYDMVLQVLNGPLDRCLGLAMTLVKDGQVMRRIPRAQRQSDYEAEQPKGVRLGYMGHVTLVADVVVGFLERVQVEDPSTYAGELADIRKERESKPLGGTRPAGLGAMGGGFEVRRDLGEDEEDAIMEVAGGIGSEQFSRYLCQQITGDWPDKFGAAKDEEGDDGEDAAMDAEWGGALMTSPFHAPHQDSDNSSNPSSPSRSSFLEPISTSSAGTSAPNTPTAGATGAGGLDMADTGPEWTAAAEAARQQTPADSAVSSVHEDDDASS
ncbi:SIT4 phosphatase-associated protein-domain-containing protein [Catenaria anguillulae PL171]|uniref:SIT4 phosphatase-associated protein-domain-containing protein n=1 Tax=Catenaria anguillulae PL171 TaxID=765915 RepID=A0A1Y2I5K7_9FUNG|nr:SIT4 phosphatase-associated protein-domain-containing protein [Catenaria anguillulae PL171]